MASPFYNPYIHAPGLNPQGAIRYVNGIKSMIPAIKKPTIPVRPNTPLPPGATPPGPPTNTQTPYMPYTDYYAPLLAQLANMRDLALSGLKTDLTGRINAVQGIVDQSRAPLNQNYSTAIQEAAAVNDAVANRLNQQGTAATNDLRSQLAALGQDPTAATADLSKYYSGTGSANYAMDSGDVQRLIGRQAEENTLLDKQPTLIANQLNQDYSQNAMGVISDYLDKAAQMKQTQAEAKAAYDQNKFQYGVDQSKAQLDQKNTDTSTYWDNYWKKQDLLFQKWQTQIASGDKKAADATRKQIADAQRQSQIDIANIRAGATETAASTRADATKAAAETRAAAAAAAAAKKKGATSNVNRQRAYQAALNAIIDPKLRVIKPGINPTGYNADWTMTRTINATLKSYGINPDTPQGRSIRASVMSQASGYKFAPSIAAQYGIPVGSRYKYDPNWVKGAQAAAAKKKQKKNYNNR